MKFCLTLMLFLMTLSPMAQADECSAENQSKGCHVESYDCDRPTHYTCERCVCDNDQNDAAMFMTSYYQNGGYRCCPVNGVEECGTKIECDYTPSPSGGPRCPEGSREVCSNAHGEQFCRCI